MKTMITKPYTTMNQMTRTLLLLTLIGVLAAACKKEATTPKVTTSEVTAITQNTAESGANLTDDGGAAINTIGICWGVNPTPTVTDSITFLKNNAVVFNGYIKGLIANTTYYVRAYATNRVGTGYGNTTPFTTLPAALPEVVCIDPDSITLTTAICGGVVTFDGGVPTTRGLCWSTSEDIATANRKTVDGQGQGGFTGTITGLLPSTTYYVWAYANNIVGTVYSSPKQFRTMQGDVVDIDGNVYKTVLIGKQEWIAKNLEVTHYSNGDPIPYITDATEWSNTSSGACCSYGNNSTNKSIYGLLYNYYTITDAREVCPDGWHVPSNAEWTTLINYLGGSDIAGYKMKTPTYRGCNSSMFSALCVGFCAFDGSFLSFDFHGYWWDDSSSLRVVYRYADSIFINHPFLNNGHSIRCIKNN